MLDAEKIWSEALIDVESELSKANFNTWFKNTHAIREERGTVFIGVPNEFVKEWLSTKYNKIILKSLRSRSSSIRGVDYTVSKKTDGKTKTVQKPSFSMQELPFDNLYVDRKDNLNPRYTFDTFVIGPFNELAYSATQAILKKIGVYNPLFIYGGTGLGKTHLIQAVGNKLKSENKNLAIYYTSTEKFVMDLVSALKNNRINAFKDKYRKYDIFIMDDVQFLSGKNKCQEELFHLFNILYDKGKQIMFSSDKHPNYIQGLEDRLKSRFSAGMIVDVNLPDTESKIAILQQKASEHGFYISDEIVEYIAQTVEGNIRELEGILNSLMIQTQLKNRELTINEVKSLIKNNIKPKKNVSIKEVVKIIADFYDLDEETIYEKTRRKEIVRSRQVAMFILREDFNISYPLIGRKLGGRDHTTVIYSCLKIKNEVKNDSQLQKEIDQLRAMLQT